MIPPNEERRNASFPPCLLLLSTIILMSSSFAKAKLKLAREAIGKKDFATVKSLADDVLEHEPTNYHA